PSEMCTLSLHDALPISPEVEPDVRDVVSPAAGRDPAHLGRVRGALERPSQQVEPVRVAEVGRAHVEEAQVLDVLRRLQELEELRSEEHTSELQSPDHLV